MAFNDDPNYFRKKAKEQDDRNKAKGVRKITLRIHDDKREALRTLAHAWNAGLYVEIRISDVFPKDLEVASTSHIEAGTNRPSTPLT